MPRRWTTYLLAGGFLVGLSLCLITDFSYDHHGSEVPFTLSHTAQACGTLATLCIDQFDFVGLRLASFQDTHESTLYEGVSLRPPFPPPRGYALLASSKESPDI